MVVEVELANVVAARGLNRLPSRTDHRAFAFGIETLKSP